MKTKFKIGDKVSWNSEAGKVTGNIIKNTLRISITKVTYTTLRKKNLNMK